MIQANVKKNLIQEILSSSLFGVVSFAVITAVAAQIAIPFKPVPFTFQTVTVILAGAFLGARNGFYSQLLYLALGTIGLPVFAEASFGPAVLFGPTGGYLLAFPIAAFLAGYLLENKPSYLKTVTTMFAANALIIAVGTAFLSTFYLKNASEAVKYGAAIFSLWTVVKVLISVNIFYFVKKK